MKSFNVLSFFKGLKIFCIPSSDENILGGKL